MTENSLQSQPWFQVLAAEVQQEFERRQEQPDRSLEMLTEETERLQGQIQGWGMSLGNRKLPLATREVIERQIDEAASRLAEVEALKSEKEIQMQRQHSLVDPDAICERLGRLDEVLAAHNPSLTNIELSQHISIWSGSATLPS